MIEPQGVVHFSIAVSDLDASRRFYTEILGLKLVSDGSAFGNEQGAWGPLSNRFESGRLD